MGAIGPAAVRRWVVIQHVAHEGPGLIADALGATGHRADVVRLDRGASLPDQDSIDGLVVLGGPMGVHDDADHPWLIAERDLIGAVVARASRCSAYAWAPSRWPRRSEPR